MHRLDHTPGIDNYRVETVPDGVHVAAYALLGHVQQARGFETQADNAYDSILSSPTLDATSYRGQIEGAARFLAGRQNPNGSWDYRDRSAGDTSISQ